MSFMSDSEEDYGDEQLTSGDDDNYAFASHEESTTRQVLSLGLAQEKHRRYGGSTWST